MEKADNKTVTFINGINDADVWILPETDENLKTTLWGTPTVSKAGVGKSYEALIAEPGEMGTYIFRMIDSDSFFYSAGGIVLEEGWFLELKENDLQYVIEVKDENGDFKETYEVFSARL